MLENYWYIITESRELKNKPIRKIIFDLPIVLFRNNTKITALEDRCAHRNAPLSAGKICNNTIQCPYHGWEYNSDGTLANIPTLEKKDCPNISIKHFSCQEQQGYIWICIGNKPTTEQPPQLPYYKEAGWTSFKMQNLFKTTTEQCLENFLDCPHATQVHKGWFRTYTNTKVKTTLKTLSDGAEVEYFEEPRKKSLVHKMVFFGKNQQMKHTDRFIAPSTSRVDYAFSENRHYIITSHCTPQSKNCTQVYTTITYKFWNLGFLARFFFEPLCRIIIKQDVNIIELQSQNIASFNNTPQFLSTEADLLLPHILKWRKSIADGSPPPKAGEETYRDLYL